MHTRYLGLDVNRRSVICLYRNPIETVFSQLNYHQQPQNCLDQIAYWSDLYGKHLSKWLYEEKFTSHKTIVTYERLKKDLTSEFEKVTLHFGHLLNRDEFKKGAKRVTLNEVKRKTEHDSQVVQLQEEYASKRRLFTEKHGDYVWEIITNGRTHLEQFINTKRKKKLGTN